MLLNHVGVFFQISDGWQWSSVRLGAFLAASCSGNAASGAPVPSAVLQSLQFWPDLGLTLIWSHHLHQGVPIWDSSNMSMIRILAWRFQSLREFSPVSPTASWNGRLACTVVFFATHMEKGSPQIDRKVLPYFLDADHFSIIFKISDVCSLYPGLRVFGFDNLCKMELGTAHAVGPRSKERSTCWNWAVVHVQWDRICHGWDQNSHCLTSITGLNHIYPLVI